MNIPLVDLQRQYLDIKKDIDAAVAKVLKNGNFILGQETQDFENSFAKYIGTKYCVGLASGMDGLLLSLRTLGVGPGDEVITVANTFIATVLPIIALGAKPILVDIDPNTYQIDPDQVEKAISKKTKVILPVHLYGYPAEMDKIASIAKKHKLFIVEDACQAHGSTIDGKKCGSFSEIAVFSFYPGKNLGAAGDGGAIVTNSKKFADRIRALRNVGQTKKYKHDFLGYNSRLDTIHGAVLSVKLKKLNFWNNKRRKLAAIYSKLLENELLVLPPKANNGFLSNYHLYVVRTSKRDKLIKFLEKNGVSSGIHYPIPIHLQKALKSLNYRRGDFPITERYAKEVLSLPMFPELEEKQVEYVAALIKKFFKEKLWKKI